MGGVNIEAVDKGKRGAAVKTVILAWGLSMLITSSSQAVSGTYLSVRFVVRNLKGTIETEAEATVEESGVKETMETGLEEEPDAKEETGVEEDKPAEDSEESEIKSEEEAEPTLEDCDGEEIADIPKPKDLDETPEAARKETETGEHEALISGSSEEATVPDKIENDPEPEDHEPVGEDHTAPENDMDPETVATDMVAEDETNGV